MCNDTNNNTTISESGGKQYAHNESSDRQEVLHQCFRQSSAAAFRKCGILDKAAAAAADTDATFSFLEIGCGSGHTTLDLVAKLLPSTSDNIKITGMDSDADMISCAEARLERDYPELAINGRVQFVHQTGESLSMNMMADNSYYDAIWLRFVVIHVPDAVALLQSACRCLKSGGILLVEDTGWNEMISDPPIYALELFHQAHANLTLTLGGDLTRGSRIGRYMKNDLALENIQCHSYVPLFGRGMDIEPWVADGEMKDDACEKTMSTKEHFALGWKLFEMSFESLEPKFMDHKSCTEEELERARASIETVQKQIAESNNNDNDYYQIFSLPGGSVFQWWGQKPS